MIFSESKSECLTSMLKFSHCLLQKYFDLCASSYLPLGVDDRYHWWTDGLVGERDEVGLGLVWCGDCCGNSGERRHWGGWELWAYMYSSLHICHLYRSQTEGSCSPFDSYWQVVLFFRWDNQEVNYPMQNVLRLRNKNLRNVSLMEYHVNK